VPTSGPGTVYLLHFDGPLGHAKHYLGFCENGNLFERIAYHLKGRGSRLVKAAVASGCGIYVVRLWKGATRDDERRLKNHSSTRYCPVCSDPDIDGSRFGPRWLQKQLEGV
jgi:predicted GIY-YIG superfamily endonuclease